MHCFTTNLYLKFSGPPFRCIASLQNCISSSRGCDPAYLCAGRARIIPGSCGSRHCCLKAVLTPGLLFIDRHRPVRQVHSTILKAASLDSAQVATVKKSTHGCNDKIRACMLIFLPQRRYIQTRRWVEWRSPPLMPSIAYDSKSNMCHPSV